MVEASRSRLFEDGAHLDLARRIHESLTTEELVLSAQTAESTRAAGDAIQAFLTRCFGQLIGEPYVCNEEQLSRRAMEDLAFSDADGLYYAVDVKTHREDSVFNRPNLVSIDRLARFYASPTNYFVLILVRYAVAPDYRIDVKAVTVCAIEHLSWDCLAIGALGRGQIQLRNAREVSIDAAASRSEWMRTFAERAIRFYELEIEKIRETRIAQFEAVREAWKRA